MNDLQRTLTDQFVEAAYAGNEQGAAEAGSEIVACCFDDEDGEWEWPQLIASGTLFPYERIPTDPLGHDEYDDILEGIIGADRLDRLDSPEDLTEEELKTWQRAIVARVLSGNNPDWSCWSVYRMTHTDGREAFLLSQGGGYSFDGSSWASYDGATLNTDAARAYFRQRGYLDLDDLTCRWPPT